jgi:hypothetical protein
LAVILASIDPNFQVSSQSGAFGSSNTVRLEITNYSEVLKVLRNLDSDYIATMRKEFKSIGNEAAKKVRRAIPAKGNPPLRNMRQVWYGRLAWGTTFGGEGREAPRPAKSVLVQLPNTRKKKYRELERAPIVRLQVGSPGTVLFDMAGRRNYSKGRKGLTPEYDYIYRVNGLTVPGKRRHRVVPGAFAKALAKTGYGRASRIVYPAVEDSMPQITFKMKAVVFKVNQRIQALLDAKTKTDWRSS